MHLSVILQAKGAGVFSIAPTANLKEAAAAMVKDRCGSLVVCEAGEPVGIVTERDILRICAEQQRPLSEVTVSECMTRRVIVGSPQDEITEIMGLMTDERIRHLPVLDGGKLVGMVSIGDLVKAQFGQLQVENHYLKHYIQS